MYERSGCEVGMRVLSINPYVVLVLLHNRHKQQRTCLINSSKVRDVNSVSGECFFLQGRGSKRMLRAAQAKGYRVGCHCSCDSVCSFFHMQEGRRFVQGTVQWCNVRIRKHTFPRCSL